MFLQAPSKVNCVEFLWELPAGELTCFRVVTKFVYDLFTEDGCGQFKTSRRERGVDLRNKPSGSVVCVFCFSFFLYFVFYARQQTYALSTRDISQKVALWRYPVNANAYNIHSLRFRSIVPMLACFHKSISWLFGCNTESICKRGKTLKNSKGWVLNCPILREVRKHWENPFFEKADVLRAQKLFLWVQNRGLENENAKWAFLLKL